VSPARAALALASAYTLDADDEPPLLIADLFAGAGGSSTGCVHAIKRIGRKMVLVCVNHDQTAINTHKKNHPAARHAVEGLNGADPQRLVRQGRLGLLMASPECIMPRVVPRVAVSSAVRLGVLGRVPVLVGNAHIPKHDQAGSGHELHINFLAKLGSFEEDLPRATKITALSIHETEIEQRAHDRSHVAGALTKQNSLLKEPLRGLELARQCQCPTEHRQIPRDLARPATRAAHGHRFFK